MINDLDLKNWKQYSHLITNSLWNFGRRRNDSSHKGDYHGNFIPQVPEQILERYTRAEDVVLDLFCGSGTTLIECKRLGRHAIGVDLSPKACEMTRARVQAADDPFFAKTRVLCGDSSSQVTQLQIADLLRGMQRQAVDHVILHPPYWDIVKFSEDARDLSACSSLDGFLSLFGDVAETGFELLKPGGFLTLVTGDMYRGGELVSLSHLCREQLKLTGRPRLAYKALYIKDIQGNEKGKGKDANLWRYRCLKFGINVLAHEYVMVFRKVER